MTTRTPLPCPQIQNRNKGPWRGLSGISAATLAAEAPTLLPCDPVHAGVDLKHRFQVQPVENAHKLAAFRYRTDARKPSDIQGNSTGIQIAFRYPSEFHMTPEGLPKPLG
jgi:hypothetical protein